MIFYKRIANNFIMMRLHVDDFYVISSTQKMLDKLYDVLVYHYKEIIRKSKDIMTYLGITIIKKNDNSITDEGTQLSRETQKETSHFVRTRGSRKGSTLRWARTRFFMRLILCSMTGTCCPGPEGLNTMPFSLNIVAPASIIPSPSESKVRTTKRSAEYAAI